MAGYIGNQAQIRSGLSATIDELNIIDGVTATTAELNTLAGVTAVVGELNALDIGSTAVGTAVASKAVILDSNKDYTGLRNVTLTGELDAGSLDISGAGDIAGALTNNSVAVKVAGKETILVPASAMQPTTSNPCSDLTTVETTSGRPDMVVLDFDKDSDEFAQFSVAFPKSWNEGTVTFQFFWSGIAATTGVTLGLQGLAVGDNDDIDVVYGNPILVDDDAQGAVEEMLVSAESAAITIAGSPAVDQLCYFRIFRDIDATNDDMAGDCRLHGVKLFFTTDAANDG